MGKIKLKKPNAVIFDISGTVTKTSFIDRILIPHITKYYRRYMEDNWMSKQTKLDLEMLSQESQKDPNAPKFELTYDRDKDIEASFAYVRYCLDNNIENKGMTLLRFHMWFDGYAKNLLITQVYSDVAIQLRKWWEEQNIKLYVFSNGWSEATKRFLSKTNHGNLNSMISGHFDTSIGQLTDPETYRKILDQISEEPENVVLLTKSADEGRAATLVGLTVVLVLTHRREIEKLDEEARKMPRVRSFHEIEFE